MSLSNISTPEMSLDMTDLSRIVNSDGIERYHVLSVSSNFWQPFLLNKCPFLEKRDENGNERPWKAIKGRSSLSECSTSKSVSVATSFFCVLHHFSSVFRLFTIIQGSVVRISVEPRPRFCRCLSSLFPIIFHQNSHIDDHSGRSLVQHHRKIPLQHNSCS